MRALSVAMRLVAAATLLGALSGCGCPEPTASVDLSSSSPSFSWPDSDAYQLIVRGPAGVYWSVQCTTGQNCIAPPVRYGLAPSDTSATVAARELDRGDYEVLVCLLCDDIPRCGPAATFTLD